MINFMMFPFLFLYGEVRVFVISLLDKKEISNVIRLLGSVFPVRELNHLKRVRIDSITHVIDVIVGKASDLEEENVKNELKDVQYTNLRTESVPSRPSLNRWQYEFSSKLWPSNFYEDKKSD